MTATASAANPRPPLVTRGAKLHDPLSQPTIGLDWIKFVGPIGLAPRVCQWLRRTYGNAEPIRTRRLNFAEWEQYPNGAEVGRGHPDGLFCVEFNGSTLAAMLPVERFRILRRLQRIGLRCTRLDGAIDFHAPEDRSVGLIAAVHDAHYAGEVCGAKAHREIRDDSGGMLRGWTVYFGKRGGNGSGRLTRVYDKGLETRTLPAGRWERYEVEFTGKTAEKTAEILAAAPDWVEALAGFVLGAIDFREARRGVSRSLARRPRCAWWEAVLRSVDPLRVSVERRAPTLETAARWMRVAVAPMLERLAKETGKTVADIWAELVGPVAPSMTPGATRRVFEFKQFREGERPWQLAT